ncbi:sushi, von Willebrand factor type A, EGF and pentraxin domain-containing protein 1-like [Artemia franciscana]|uniref:sushi, von Willebrand factor type A, EGF and pentraxin domain-containing protein 1-like n=1 Tax=Artemia franciscana TaxID=6661 RepID=UPI0032DBBA2D
MLIFIFIFALSLACKEIPKVINGIFHLSTKQIEIGTEATLECFNGFDNQPQDVRSLSCGEDGTWKTKESKDLPSCLERTCPHVKQLIYGSSEIDGLHAANGGYSDGTVIMYSCAPGYILIGPQKRLCRNGNWSGEDPECLQRLCSVPPEVSHSVVKIQAAINMSPLSSHFPPGSVGTYYCYPGYEAAGTSSVKCDADGLWKPDSAVQCVPREGTPCQDCCNISNIWPHAKITVIQGTFTPRGALPGTLIEVTCVDGYKNMRELSCNSTGLRMHCKMSLWIGISPQCTEIQRK